MGTADGYSFVLAWSEPPAPCPPQGFKPLCLWLVPLYRPAWTPAFGFSPMSTAGPTVPEIH